MLICSECDLHYEVVWNNDGCGAPVVYCPRCGSEFIACDDQEEQG
jgi:hypothetical protein